MRVPDRKRWHSQCQYVNGYPPFKAFRGRAPAKSETCSRSRGKIPRKSLAPTGGPQRAGSWRTEGRSGEDCLTILRQPVTAPQTLILIAVCNAGLIYTCSLSKRTCDVITQASRRTRLFSSKFSQSLGDNGFLSHKPHERYREGGFRAVGQIKFFGRYIFGQLL